MCSASEGSRTAGTDVVLMVRPAAGGNPPTAGRRPADPGLVALPPPLLLVTTNLEGAVFFPRPGYALTAGTAAFLAGAAPEGVDQERARFARYARAATRKWPVLESIARSFPPGHVAWKYPGDVPEATATGRQLALMRDLSAGRCTGAEFAVGWLDARRRSQQRGVSGPAIRWRLSSIVSSHCWRPTPSTPGSRSPTTCRTTNWRTPSPICCVRRSVRCPENSSHLVGRR